MKKNKLFSLILLVAIFFSLYAYSGGMLAHANTPFVILGYEYCDGLGNTVTELTPSATITAKATIKKNVSGDAPVTLMFAAYKDGKMISLSKDVDTLTDALHTKELTASITLPADVTGCTLKNFVVDDILNIESLTSSATFNSDNADIISATVAGIEIASFDENNSATVVLPANAPATPSVEWVCDDYTTAVTKTYTDGVITLTATSTGGTVKTYTVNYTKAEPQLTDVTFRQYRWLDSSEYASPPADSYTDFTGDDLKVVKAISLNLDAVEDKTQTLATLLGITDSADMATKVTPQFSTSGETPKWYYSNIDATFDGLNMVVVPYSNAVPGEQSTVIGNHAEMTFTTNKSVRIYYIAHDVFWRSPGATELGTYVFNVRRSAVYPTCADETIQYILDNTQTLDTSTQFSSKVCTQDIIVPGGSDSVTATVKIRSNGQWNPPFFAYEFID